jgi:hypothetical protein
MFVTSSFILSLRYSLFLFLKCLLASRLMLFRLSSLISPGSCNYWNLACFLLSNNFEHLSSNHDRLCGLMFRVPGYRSRDSGFDSRCYHIFWEVVGLERGPLNLMSTIEEPLGRNSSGSGLENREYGRGDPLPWPHDTLYPQKLALTSPASGGRSVGIVRLRTEATEFVFHQTIAYASSFSNNLDSGWLKFCYSLKLY